MKPYLAVITDSFRAAFTSRVLWVALAAIYLFLFASAPIGYREVFTTSIRWFDFSNGTRMKAMLAQDIDKEKPTPAGIIARSLHEELKNNLRKVAQGEEVRIQLDLLANSLNALMDKEDWYDETVWKGTNRLRELRELDSKPNSELTDELKKRRARLRIEAALPGVFESRAARSVALTYAGFDFPAVFQIDPAQFKLILNHFVLRFIIDWVLGFIMIFLGILVTAAIVPDMLQPGSLHLLLSKPVSRSLLFLAKFIGGCAFVLVCVAQLIVGLWLISGFRLDIWNARLLLCIPVCVFLFAVFYSVSAVAGLKWRSPILSIGLANAFGALCLFIGVAGGVSDGFITEPDRIEALAISGDTVVASTRGANLRRFDPQTKTWVDLFPDDNGGGDRILPPATLQDGRIVTARVRGGRMNMFGSGATSMLVLDRREDWKPSPSIELPTSTSQLIATASGELVAMNSSELMVADKELLEQPIVSEKDAKENVGEAKATSDENVASKWLPKLLKMMGGATAGFSSIAPREVSLASPRSVVFALNGNAAFVCSSGKLIRLDCPKTDEPKATWVIGKQIELNVDNKQVWLRIIGNELAVIRSKFAPQFFDFSLAPVAVTEPSGFEFDQLKISDAVGCNPIPGIAILSAEGIGYILKRDEASGMTMSPISRMHDLDSMVWDPAGKRLWASHDVDSVTAFDIESAVAVSTLKPSVKGWRLADRYIMTPLRTVTPQTGELGETIATIVSGDSTIDFPMAPEDTQPQRYNVWRPVFTCAGFIFVMLTIGCVYFSRADF